ncbi:MAG: DegT/DnrJ/EryC1/StrS family aminotransferase, partial [Vicinamibacteria bacterium]
DSFNLDPRRIEEQLSESSRAIVPVHLYGRSSEMGPILSIAEDRGLVVIEDAAQAIGARDESGRRTGSMGNIGALSFYPSKNLGAMGDAGMVLTREPSLWATLKRLRSHGASRDYLHETVGGNFRLDAFQAAVLRVKLPYLNEWNRKRRERARAYDQLFSESGLVEEGLVRPPALASEHVFHQYVIRARRRDELKEHLAEEGVGTGVYYPLPLHLQPCFRDLGYARGDFPVAEKTAEESLALPMFPDLNDEQQRTVVGAISAFYGLS